MKNQQKTNFKRTDTSLETDIDDSCSSYLAGSSPPPRKQNKKVTKRQPKASSNVPYKVVLSRRRNCSDSD